MALFREREIGKEDAMAMGRVEFANGIASVYDEIGRLRTTKHCERLVGYGPKGFVIKSHGFYYVHDPNGALIKQNIVERVFLQEQFSWHDNYLQIRC